MSSNLDKKYYILTLKEVVKIITKQTKKLKYLKNKIQALGTLLNRIFKNFSPSLHRNTCKVSSLLSDFINSNSKKTRNSVKVLLFNKKNELLLMKVDDPDLKNKNGIQQGIFWALIGGKIEKNENLYTAAIREIFEETGLTSDQVTLGPIIWENEFEMYFKDQLSFVKQKFIVGKTNNEIVTLSNLVENEITTVKELKWFSVQEIENLKERIYPLIINDLLKKPIVKKYFYMPLQYPQSK